MMAPRKTYDHFYEWAGDYIREAMKGWGLATVLILIGAGVASYLAITYGGPYIQAKTAKMVAEATASTAVSEAVTKLTALTETSQANTQQVMADMKRANEMMKGTPGERVKTNELLGELVDGMKATAEELREFRKNESAPPATTASGA